MQTHFLGGRLPVTADRIEPPAVAEEPAASDMLDSPQGWRSIRKKGLGLRKIAAGEMARIEPWSELIRVPVHDVLGLFPVRGCPTS